MIERRRQNKYVRIRRGRNVSDRTPKISVIMPAYNSSEFIIEALDSVLGQRYREHEIIVINDGSPDTEKFERVITSRLDDIIYIKQRNAGAGIARNTGIENARGEIIAFLDADDVWLPNFLSSQVVFLERHNYDMVYCDAFLFGLNPAVQRTFMETAPSEGEATFDSILDLRCNVITSGTMARKQAIQEVGMFEKQNVRADDFILWLKMAKNGAKIGYQRKQLLKYRERLDSLSGDSISRVEREHDAFERVARDFDLTPEQKAIVSKHLADLEANLAVEHGKTFLLNGDFREAETAFRIANRHRESLKLSIVALLTRIAPGTLLKYYRSRRAAEIAFITPHNKRSKSVSKLKRLIGFWYVISDQIVETLTKF